MKTQLDAALIASFLAKGTITQLPEGARSISERTMYMKTEATDEQRMREEQDRQIAEQKRAARRKNMGRRNARAQAAYDDEWGTDNGYAPWDNRVSASDY